MTTPTLLEWMGGRDKLQQLLAAFYARVPQDEILAPVFARMPKDHFERVADFIAEVFGGRHDYSERHGGHAAMIRHHQERSLEERHRQRWMQLLLECADDAGLPADPEFRSALVAYLEWGSRLAILNSQPGAPPPTEAPMPKWGWGETGGPFIDPAGKK